MKFKSVIIISTVLLFGTTSFAQNTNAQKILGCWVLKNAKIAEPDNNSDSILKEALNSVVCFYADGKYTTQLADKKIAMLKGNYSISEDGKTLRQSRDENNDGGIDEDGQIMALDDKHLIFQTESVIIFLERQ